VLDQQTFILVRVLGEDDPQVRSLLWAANRPHMRDAVPGMVRALCRERGIDPDNPPAFGLPAGLPPPAYPLGRAKCGNVLGGPVGPGDGDLRGHIGFFGATGMGKSTLVRLFILAFAGANP